MSRKYYELDEDLYIKNRWHLAGPRDDELRDEREFRYGQRVALRGPLVAPIHTSGIALDFTQTTNVVPILSRRLADAIRTLVRDDAQLFPVGIEGYPGFEVMNVTTLLQCVDESRSDFTRWTLDSARPDRVGQYHFIRKLYVDINTIPGGTHVFRILNYARPLLVSQQFVDAMLALNPSGPKFEIVT